MHQPLRFQGQYEDEESGLYYNCHRYYDPDSARFINQDPIGLAGGVNPYVYGPNPIGWIDPNGLKRTPHSGTCADDAARSALNSANPKSIRRNQEYGGLIYEKGGKYFATIPVAGSGRTFKPMNALPQVPSGATIVGDYHTHGDYSVVGSKNEVIRTGNSMKDDFDSDNFSESDKKITAMATLKNRCHQSYLGTPSGQFKKYTVLGGVRGL